MSHFDGYYSRPRRGFFSTLILLLIGGILGGLMSLFIAINVPFISDKIFPSQSQDQGQFLPPIIPSIPTDEQWPVVAIAQEVGPAVVGVTNVRSTGRLTINRSNSGSGVIFDRRGYIVTNYHVIEGAQEIVVTLDEERSYQATLIGADRSTDLAVLKIDALNLPVAVFGDSTNLKVGELAVAIGNPLGAEFARSVTAGVISALNREIQIEDIKLTLIQTDAAINPGNSGGALVNARGQVVGINSVKIATAQVEGMGFAIPISDAKPILDELIEKGYVSRPFLGIVGQEINEQQSQWYDLPLGIFITEVQEGGPAQQAGIRPEDVLLEMNNKEIKDFVSLKKELDSHRVGDKVNIKLWRKGEQRTIEVTLGERQE
jgi:serine protease Do